MGLTQAWDLLLIIIRPISFLLTLNLWRNKKAEGRMVNFNVDPIFLYAYIQTGWSIFLVCRGHKRWKFCHANMLGAASHTRIIWRFWEEKTQVTRLNVIDTFFVHELSLFFSSGCSKNKNKEGSCSRDRHNKKNTLHFVSVVDLKLLWVEFIGNIYTIHWIK
jgi:hypothetical protein